MKQVLRVFVSVCICVLLLHGFTNQQTLAQQASAKKVLKDSIEKIKDAATEDEDEEEVKKPRWQTRAEAALVGTWELADADVNVIPKLRISFDDQQLQIQFWGRGSTDKEPGEDASDLHVLSRYQGTEVDGETAVAFATHEADYGVMHFTLKLQDGVLAMDGVKIVKDPTKRVNRIVSAAYAAPGKKKRVSDTEAEMEEAAESTKEDSPEKVAKNEASDAKEPAKSDKPVKRGEIAGKIETGSTLRGVLTLSPMPAKAGPVGGISVGGSNPRFSFTNVPEGEYSVVFQGTVNGSTQRLTWKDLEIDTTGESPSLSLSVRSAE